MNVELVKLVLVFIILFALLFFKKIPISIVLLLVSVLIGLFFQLDLKGLIICFYKGITSRTTISLIIIVYLILVLSQLLNHLGSIKRMVEQLNAKIKNIKFMLPIFPALIGMLPMPGGAMFSAPITEKVCDRLDLTGEHKTYINYTFRHIWEPIWPLYPGLLLEAELLGVPIESIILYQWPITVAILLSGVLTTAFIVRGSAAYRMEKTKKFIFSQFILDSLPFLLIIIMILISMIIIKINIIIILLTTLILMFIVNRRKLDFKIAGKIFKKAFSWNTTLLIIIIFFFQQVLSATDFPQIITDILITTKIPIATLIIALPFITAFISGLTPGFVAISYPLIASIFFKDGVNLYIAAAVFLSGFAGLLFSPTHLCLVLTREYFKATLSKIYKLMIPLGIILTLLLIVYMLLGV